MLHNIIETITPQIIYILELMGIIILTISAVGSFISYIVSLFTHKPTRIKYNLANSMATALEFKLGAEILKTVIIRDFSEILILGAIILLRGLMAFIIYAELKADMAIEAQEALCHKKD